MHTIGQPRHRSLVLDRLSAAFAPSSQAWISVTFTLHGLCLLISLLYPLFVVSRHTLDSLAGC